MTLIFFVCPFILAQDNEINATITGQATSSGASLTIVVQAAPIIELYRPVNGTYLTGQNISLNFSSFGSDFVWYNVDNGGNQSLNSNRTLSVSSGAHTLRIYANNSYGFVSKNVTFRVNNTILNIDYSEFNSSENTGSTDFFHYSFEELQNLSDLILRENDYGELQFNENINLSDDINYSDGVVNISENVIISQNYIEINTTALPNLNKSATLKLFNLSFSNPRILMDGVVCPESVCQEISYSGGTFEFNVEHFTTYSAEETPVTSPPGGSGSPGGSGGIRDLINIDFNLSDLEIIVNIDQGETKEKILTIKNTHSKSLNFEVKGSGLNEFMIINEPSFILKSGEAKSLSLDFIARESSIPGFYVGKLIVKTSGLEKEILVVLNVDSKDSLFDIEAVIPERYEYVIPGEELLVIVNLHNLGETGRVDAVLDYIIKDEEGNLITTLSDTLAVETSASLTKSISLPLEIDFGKYILYVSVTYDGKTASSSSSFEVVASKVPYGEKIYISLIIIIVILISLFGYLYLKRKEEPNKIEIQHLMKKGEEKDE